MAGPASPPHHRQQLRNRGCPAGVPQSWPPHTHQSTRLATMPVPKRRHAALHSLCIQPPVGGTVKYISPHRFRLSRQRLHTTSPAEVHEVGHSPVIRSAGGSTVASRRQGVSPTDQPDPLCLLRSRARACCGKPHTPQRTLHTNEELRMNRRWSGGARRAQHQTASRARKEDPGHRRRAGGAALSTTAAC